MRKRYMIFASTLAMSLPIGALISCGNSKTKDGEQDANIVSVSNSAPSKTWAKDSRRNITVVSANIDGRQPYIGQGYRFIPNVTNSGGDLAEAQNSVSAQGFTIAVENFPKYGVDGKLISGKISESHLEFALYDRVTVILRDQTRIDFNSDSTDANDQNSINGKNFKNTISGDGSKQVAAFEFHLRDGVKWVDSKGEEVADVTTDDIWETAQQGIASFGKERNNALGTISGYLDATWNNKYQTSFAPFSPQAASSPWRGSYRTSYGLDVSAVADGKKDEFVNEKERTNTIKFVEGTETHKIVSYWTLAYANSAGPVILPVKQYKKATETVSDELINGYIEYVKNLGQDTSALTKDQIKTEIQESLGWKTGFYGSYALGALDYWSAGQYYTSKVTEKNIVFTQNKHFANQKWVQLKNTILTYNYEYINGGGDSQASLYEGYKQGLYTSFLEFDDLPDSVKKEALTHPEEYGLRFSKGRTALNQVDTGYTRFNFLNLPATADAAKHFYFNDAFAKVAFGAKNGLKDLLDGTGVFQDASAFAEANFHGSGAEFRSSIFAAINWFTGIYDYSHHKSQEWTSRLAPEQTLTADTGDHGLISPIDVEDIYSSYGLGFENAVPSLTQVTHQERVKVAIDTSREAVDRRYLVDQEDLVKLKANVKHALDTAGIKKGEKVIFQLPHGYTDLNRDYRLGLEGVRNAINSLDERLLAVASFKAIDPSNTADNPTDGSKAAEGWRESFSPEDPNWTILGPGVKDQKVLTDESVRRVNNRLAVLPFALRSGLEYEVDALSQVWTSNLGFLQDGVLLALSYYRQHGDQLPAKFAYLKDFSEKTGSLIDGFFHGITLDRMKDLVGADKIARFDADDLQKLNLIQTGLSHFEFNKVIESKAADLAYYDYFGFAGEKEWTDLTNYLNDESFYNNFVQTSQARKAAGAAATADQVQAYNEANHRYQVWKLLKDTTSSVITDILNKQVEFELRSWFDTVNQDQKTQILTALDTYIGGAWTLQNMGIGNRENLTPVLVKDWYHTNGDVYHISYLASFRVDLE